MKVFVSVNLINEKQRSKEVEPAKTDENYAYSQLLVY